MKKRIFSFFAVLTLLLIFVTPVFAQETHDARVVDNAELLTQSEVQELTKTVDEISERQRLDVVIVTVKSLEGKTAEAFADDYYDYNNYGFGESKDGVLLLLSMEYRDWHITTTGYGITAFTDAGISHIGSEIVPYFSSGDYYEGFSLFASEADKFISQSKEGSPYDTGHLPRAKKKLFSAKSLLIALAIGVLVSFIITSSIKSKYKPVRFKSNASDYLADGSLKVTGAFDTFLYSNVSKTERNTDSGSGGSSTHSGSSGTSHGGGGGKF